MKLEKEIAFENFIEMIKNSWTYARMTESEKEKIVKILNEEKTKKAIKGTYKQRWSSLQIIYSTFLAGLNYDPLHWRE